MNSDTSLQRILVTKRSINTQPTNTGGEVIQEVPQIGWRRCTRLLCAKWVQNIVGFGLRPEFSSWKQDSVSAITVCRSQRYWIILDSLYPTNPNQRPTHRFRHWHICLAVCSHALAQFQFVPANTIPRSAWTPGTVLMEITDEASESWGLLSVTLGLQVLERFICTRRRSRRETN